MLFSSKTMEYLLLVAGIVRMTLLFFQKLQKTLIQW